MTPLYGWIRRKCRDSCVFIYTTQNGGTALPALRITSLPVYAFFARSVASARTTCRSGQLSRQVMVRSGNVPSSDVQPMVASRSPCRLSLRLLGSSAPRLPAHSSRSVKERNETAASAETARVVDMANQAPASNPCCDTVSNAANADTAAIPLAAPASMPLFVLFIAYHLRKCGIWWIPSSTCKFSPERLGDGKACVKFPVIFRIYDFGNADFSQLTGNAYRPAPRAVAATRGAGRFHSTRHHWEVFG